MKDEQKAIKQPCGRKYSISIQCLYSSMLLQIVAMVLDKHIPSEYFIMVGAVIASYNGANAWSKSRG